MVQPGDVIDVPALNLRFEIRATAASTNGEYAEFDAIGSPRGFIRLMHVHVGVTERHEVLEGVLKIKLAGKVHTLHPGDTLTIPPDAPHYQRSGGDGIGRVRIRHTPAGRIDEFLGRLAQIQYNRFGFPRPHDGARFVADLGEAGHAARPSLKLQQRIARAVLAEYEFVDEWHVDAPPEAVFDVLADGQTYPRWWKPVYIDVRDDGEYTHQHFKGRLPYHLHTRTRTVRSERPHVLEGETDGDLRGTGIWTLTPSASGGTHVRFDWRVHADRRLLRILTPLLRPALRWNHNWAIARAIEGLEPYAKAAV
jgi:uncharacterized protein YndB with AHSA1/START domain/mannose-6-phosphate isomerase-like protein (cupin superfamily)